ncbi:MAG: precorrin-2 dehydrogenase/sirohydrochlorin ferrochelatase family protein [Planctomycetota bacterium]|jgi:siroheme synthase-like protein
MKTYPVMLVLEGAQTVVIGGGGVGVRKVGSLLAAGAKVRLVSKDLPADADLTGVEVVHSDYESRCLAGAKLVFACTDDAALNASIADDARKIGAIVNCVDQPADCDFFVPAMVSDGDVVVAIGTGGASPVLAGQLKRCVADALPERIGDFVSVLLQLRDRVKAEVDDLDRRSAILKVLAGQRGYDAFLGGGAEAVAAVFDELVS